MQLGAEAVCSPEDQDQVLVSFFMENAAIILQELKVAGLAVYGGQQAPYVWI
jgi:LL-diaminopimelate aminotransferase